MLSHAKYCYRVIWLLDGMGICLDIIRWEIFPLLFSYEKLLCKKIGSGWREELTKCFIYCCSGGRFGMVKWLYTYNLKRIDLFIEDICKSMRRLKKDYNYWGVTRSIDFSQGFYLSCQHGNLDIAKWIWKICDHIRLNVNSAFQVACYNDRLSIIQWLWDIAKKDINFHKVCDRIFRDAGVLTITEEICKYPINELDKAIDSGIIFEGGSDEYNTDIMKFLWKIKGISPICTYMENGRFEYLVYEPELSNRWFLVFKDGCWSNNHNGNWEDIYDDRWIEELEGYSYR